MTTTSTGRMTVPITRPLLGPREELAVLEVLRSGWLVQGPKVAEFESALADLNRALEIGRHSESRVSLAYAHSGRALAFAGLERFEESGADFDQSIREALANVRALHGFG